MFMSSCQCDTAGAGEVGVRCSDHLVAFADAECHHAQEQCVGPVGDTDRVLRSAELREVLLEGGQFFAQDEGATVHQRANAVHHFLLDPAVLRTQIHVRDFHGRHHRQQFRWMRCMRFTLK
jgi:hypothetical protein